ncbi:hypothetical protein PHLH6_52280 [Pseudomonas sp. Seg1]|uniref:hypothetical protein n=1 Tax=unclassified Pseudomonas TaxID=196821 RepID=UPI000CD0A8EC|nr:MULTISPECIES: hypothetical protein [unclassified Pseudomonas]POA48700.1 hypothetical protein C1893_10265 [Pseudomonas sp. MPR-ANC1]BBP73224.1 hypothetical protein PHLH6_52280 [Pseudomonas sp. Seg1]
MRWLFLLLVVLNVFYYVWHQQEAPLRAKDVTPLSLYKGSQQDIRLLSETAAASRGRSELQRSEEQCLYVGGFVRQELVVALSRRLSEMDIKAQPLPSGIPASGFWLRVAPESQRLLGDPQLQNLSNEFNELKHKIMLCEGVAPTE